MGPLAHDLGVPDGARGTANDADPAVSHLVAVAVRAVEDVSSPAVAQSLDVWELVAQAGRYKQPPGRDALTIGEQHPESTPAVGDEVANDGGDDVAALLADLPVACVQRLCRRHAVAREMAV